MMPYWWDETLCLPVNLKLEEGESTSSHFHRSLLHNYAGDSQPMRVALKKQLLTAGHKDNPDLPKEPESVAILAHCVGLPIQQFLDASPHRWTPLKTPFGEKIRLAEHVDGTLYPLIPTNQIAKHIRPVHKSAYCPCCLEENGIHKLIWMSQLIEICPEHHCLLITSCPDCDSNIPVKSVVEGVCHHCRKRLVGTEPIPVRLNADHKQTLGRLESLLRFNDVSYAPGWTPRAVYQWFCEIPKIITDTSREGVAKRQETRWETPEQKRFVEDMTEASDMFDNWPEAFHIFLDRHRGIPKWTLHNKGIEDDLGRLLWNNLYRFWQHEEIAHVTAAFDQYCIYAYGLATTFRKSVYFKNHADLAQRMTYLMAKSAANKLNIHVKSLAPLVETGWLNKYQADDSNSRLYDRTEIKRLHHRWQRVLHPKQIARVLGISREDVFALHHAGYFDVPNDYDITQGLNERYVIVVMAKIAQQSNPDLSPDDSAMISFKEAWSMVRQVGFNTADLLYDTLHYHQEYVPKSRWPRKKKKPSRFVLRTKKPSIREMFFERSYIESMAESVRYKNAWLTIDEAANHGQVDDWVIEELVEMKQLDVVAQHDQTAYLDKNQIHNFFKTYLSFSQAVEEYETHPEILREGLKSYPEHLLCVEKDGKRVEFVSEGWMPPLI